jgi:hypothetical protein
MPDNWEKAHGLNPEDPQDSNEIGKDGYTNLEIYLNSLVKSNGSSLWYYRKRCSISRHSV